MKKMNDIPQKVKRAWANINYRCNNSKDRKYKYYGGRGIKCLFENLEEFWNEVGNSPTENHSIDRIDNNGNYEKGNVRWATREEQTKNRIYKTKPKKIFTGTYLYASEIARHRWKNVSKKERSRIMSELSKKGVEARKKLSTFGG